MSTAAKPRPILSEASNLRPGPVLAANPEFDLLLACCAHPARTDHLDRIRRLLSVQMNWERWLNLVDHHRVVPQVYRALAKLQEWIPDETFAALQTRYENNARNALWFTGELVRIVTHLESVGIKTLPYKGPALAQTLYGEVTQRQFCDLDILIRPADVVNARTALLGLGYKSELKLTQQQEQAYLHSGYEYSFNRGRSPHLLELQWQILPRFYAVDFCVADFFDRANNNLLGGRRIPTLAAPDLLLVLCAHSAKHLWTQLSWLCDIARLVTVAQLDWNKILQEAGRLGIERILCLNLLFANQLLGAALPPSIQERVRQDEAITILAHEIRRIIENSQPYDTESIPYFRLMMRLRERQPDRTRFITRLAFTPSISEWSAIRLPESLTPLYRVVRLFRLAKKLAEK